MRGRRAVLVAAMAFAAASARAHDFWIEPSSFRPEVGSDLAGGLAPLSEASFDDAVRVLTNARRILVVANGGSSTAATAFAVRFLLRFFETNRLTPFGIYCIVAGLSATAVIAL